MITRKRILERFLGVLWRLVSTSPGTTVTVGAILAILSVLAATLFLRVNADQNHLVSPEVPYFKTYLKLLKNFGDQEYLYVVIKADGTAENKKNAERFSESLAERLRKDPKLIRAIYYRISAQDFGDRALLFASTKEAEMLSKTVVSLAPYINDWLKERNLTGFLDQISRILEEPQGNLSELDPAMLGQFLDPLVGFLKNLGETVAGGLPEKFGFDIGGDGTRYYFTSNGELLIMRVLPEKDFGTMDVIGKPLRAVRSALEKTRTEYPRVEAGLTGRPVLQADEMQTSNRDMTRAAIIACVLIGILFTVILHGWLRPLLVLIALGIAIAWTFGFTTATVGELNLLSMVFVLVLVGIGVDFGIHLVMRYVELHHNGVGPEDAVQKAIFKTGPGIILGALTSVCAFYAVLDSNFLGLAELGLIGGTGILLSLLAMLTVLPSLILIAGKRHYFPSSKPRVVAMPFLERLSNRPGLLLMVLAAVSLAGLPGLLKARFNYNLLDLQARGLESVNYERLLIKDSGDSTWYAILTADTVEQMKDLIKKVKALPSVGNVESILDFIPKAQAQKSTLYETALMALDGATNHGPKSGPPDPTALVKSLERLSGALESLEEKLFAAGATQELAVLDQGLDSIQSSMERIKQNPAEAKRLAVFQAELRRAIEGEIAQLKRRLSVNSVIPEDLPAALRHIYVGKDGRYQIKVNPSKNIWEFDNLERFVSDLRRVDPDVSGTPVTVLESARLMHRTFLYAAGLTVVLVSLILYLYARSITYVLLTLLPLGVGVLWLLEFMGWFGLNFNLANFFAIPILIAIGVHGGVHFLARWKELQGRGGLFSTSTPTAVTLTFATTIIGFGGLLFAHHQGMASLGMMMVLGSLTSLLAHILVLPAVLKLIGNLNGKET